MDLRLLTAICFSLLFSSSGLERVRRSLGKIGVQLWKWFSSRQFCDPGWIGAVHCVETLE